MTPRPLPDPEALASAVAAGERAALARAITLVESNRMDHQVLARRMLEILMPLTGKAQRVGITGVPGAGKSTTIEALGGKLHHLFFAFGQYDVICLIEAPDDKTMMAGAAAVASAGTVSASSTIKLMTSADAMAAMTLAGKVTGSYKPPHA